MSELAKAVLCFLQTESSNGKTSFAILDLVGIGKISTKLAQQIIDELEENGYIEVHHNIANTFSLI